MSDDRVQVDESLTRKVADLARLELSSDEVKTYTSQLGQILDYVTQLQAVNIHRADGSEVAALYSPLELNAPLREDVVRELPCAPADENGFKVPQVIG